MSEVTTTAPVTGTGVVKKVGRRGVANARGAERLRFTHELANKMNGLFVAHLDSVEVRKITIGEDATGMPSFNGMEIPQLVLTFASNEPEINKRHYITKRFSAVESNADTIPGGKSAWTVDTVFNWIRHIYDVFVLKGREFVEAEEAALSLPFDDFDEQGEYVPVEPETVIAGWTSLFENFVNLMNTGNDGAPVYTDKNGKPLPLWMKLLRYQKVTKKKVSTWQALANGELTFPTFVGEGCLELYKANVPASIRLNAVKESIIPRNDVEKPKTPNMPMAGGSAPMAGGVVMGGEMPMGTTPFGPGLAAEAQEDMPF